MNGRLVAALMMSGAVLSAAFDTDIDRGTRGVLTRHLRFGALELTDLERGKVVKHSIDTSAPGEVAVAGAVRVQAPKGRFLERLRDIAHFKRGPEILQIGRFSASPVIEDLASLTIDKDDFDPRSCHVGDCNVRLPADIIRRFEREIDTSAPDAQVQAAALFKQVLLEHVRAYVSGGGDRMVQFDDGEKPIRPADEFAGVLKNASAVAALAPGLPEHLSGFPANRVDGAEDFLYWSKEKFGVGPFISVTHVTIVCQSEQTCVITTKDVYSSRYLDASLALTIATDAVGTPDAFYLVYANRSRANALKGWFSALKRTIVERRARASLDTNLRMLKTELEQSF